MFYPFLFILYINFAFVVFTTKWCPPMVHRPEVRPWLPSQSGCPSPESSPQVYTRSSALVKFPFRKTYSKTVFFSILKKKLLEKKYKSRTYIPLVHYNTVAKPQLLPSNMLYIVGRLHIRVDECYS